MKGLLTKELLLTTKNMSMLIIIILFAVMGIVCHGTFYLVYPAILLGSMAVGNMSFDETSRWQQYSLALPYKRSHVVSAKYILTIIMALISTVIMALGLSVNMIRDNSFDIQSFTLSLSFAPALCLIFPAALFPINFKFGTAKATVIRLIIFGGIVACITAVVVIALDGIDDTSNLRSYVISRLTSFSRITLASMILCATAIIYALSWIISIRIFEKKDL